MASAEYRTLAVLATVPGGTVYFVAELAVADHSSEFYLTGSVTPLPAELVAFTTTPVGNTAVRLTRTTASEKNSKAFGVERSADGMAFVRLGMVVAAGSSVCSYGFLDAKLPAGVVRLYYRLQQVDMDGTVAYLLVR